MLYAWHLRRRERCRTEGFDSLTGAEDSKVRYSEAGLGFKQRERPLARACTFIVTWNHCIYIAVRPEGLAT